MICPSAYYYWLLLLSILLLTANPSHASLGDVDAVFQDCLSVCVAECSSLASIDSRNQSLVLFQQEQALRQRRRADHGSAYAPAVFPLPWYLTLTGWDCPANCKYDCMHAHAAAASQEGRETVKYYGKWPFTRVMGMQELFSVLFSIANLIPHLYYFIHYPLHVNKHYSMRSWWTACALVNVNTWLWSAVFHARDVLLTERLDYFSASFGIVFSFLLQIIRSFHITRTAPRWCLVTFGFTIFLYHITYLHFIHFDYGWNMTVSLTIGISYSLFCIITACVEQRPYARTIILSHVYLWSVALFEVCDFPPIASFLDAHAIWHGLTPPIAVMFWRVQLQDAEWEMNKEKRKKDTASSSSLTDNHHNGVLHHTPQLSHTHTHIPHHSDLSALIVPVESGKNK